HTSVDTMSCGTCGRSCSTVNGTASCAGGSCAIACASGFGDCDGDVTTGCETNLNTSVANCNTCGHACSLANATAACTRGACVIASCTAGYSDCNGLPPAGCEVHTAVDTTNCGTCGHACSTVNGSASCAAGTCAIACASGFGDCNGDASDGC